MGSYFSIEYMLQALPVLLSFSDITLGLTFVASVLAIAMGSLVALCRVERIRGLSEVSGVYISFIRGTPFLVQLYLICFGLPQIITKLGYGDVKALPVLLFVVLVMMLHSAAYVAEILRGSIESIDKGQLEAALSCGMTKAAAYRRVILPQAFRTAIPALSNEIISTLKNTSLVFNVGVVDMLSKAELMATYSYRSLELYLDVGLIYIFFCFIGYILTGAVERATSLTVKTRPRDNLSALTVE